MRRADVELQARQQLGDDDVSSTRRPRALSRHAALEQERPPLVVASDEPHRATAAPELECVGLVIRLEVRRRVQLEHDVTGGDDEGVRRLDRLLELERPLLAHSATSARQRFEPVGLVAPCLGEGARNAHREAAYGRP